MTKMINEKNQKVLLAIARNSLEMVVRERKVYQIDEKTLDAELKQDGASFVTLHQGGQLRGCIGTLVAIQPLFRDVADHAIAAGTQDYRFPPVSAADLPALGYEISVLSPAVPLVYNNPADLLQQIIPGVHGVVLVSGQSRATFLPQVWNSIPQKEEFLNQLCLKMGVPAKAWIKEKFDVLVYEVQEFSDS
jgi:AmmeMemoRadiSam system protein A